MRLYENFSEEQRQLLRDRAARIARSVEDNEPVQLHTVLPVSIRGENYVLPADAVSAVYEGIQIMPVPNAPTHILGIANIRGRVIVIADLGQFLEIPGSGSAGETVSIVVMNSDLQLAFQVDSIEGLELLPVNSLTHNLPNLKLINKAYLQGISPEGKALLNINTILHELASTTS
jgi:chemotaxis signal transduction protein